MNVCVCACQYYRQYKNVYQLFSSECEMNNAVYKVGESVQVNCNLCICIISSSNQPEMSCDQSECLIQSSIIQSINGDPDRTWRASNQTTFWGTKLSDGLDYYLGTLVSDDEVMQQLSVSSLPTPEDIPHEWDHRTTFNFGRALHQGQCGASYAFSTIQMMNARIPLAAEHAGHPPEEPKLSAQQFVECMAPSEDSPGACQGAQLEDSWDYFERQGITNSECYPYTSGVNGAVETCQLDTSCPSFTVGKRIRLECEEDIQRDIMAFGPVQAIVEVAQDLFHYESGVYQPTMDTPLDRATFHSVILLGWGKEKGVPYWLARNSWGNEWGECVDLPFGRSGQGCGYFKIVRGQNAAHIESLVISAHPNLADMIMSGEEDI